MTTQKTAGSVWPPTIAVAATGLTIQVAVSALGGYGIFRDELYYLACSRHLDWGYVDQPPLSALLLACVRLLFGESLVAIRLLPALAFAALILLTGALVEQMGGGRRAAFVATSSVLVAPVLLGVCGFYSMNAFDLVAWSGCLLLVARIAAGNSARLWLLLGLVVGLAALNKVSILFLVFGLGVGLLATPHRRHLLSPWLWAGAAVAALIAAPYGIWQLTHDFATLEFMRNASRYKNAATNPLSFFVGQIMMMHPANVLAWLTGFVYLLVARPVRAYRLFALAYVATFLVFALGNGKDYYLAGFYPVLLAAGAVAIERLSAHRGLGWVPVTLAISTLVSGALISPYALPILPPEDFIRYTRTIGISPGGEERDRPSALGQHYADMFGWREMARTVADAYQTLTTEEKAEVVIFGQNYGQAGAIDHFGRAMGLPGAISGHNNYWLWGPGDRSGQVAIIIGGAARDNAAVFDRCDIVAVHRHPYARSFETDLPISICRGLRTDLRTLWPRLRHYI